MKKLFFVFALTLGVLVISAFSQDPKDSPNEYRAPAEPRSDRALPKQIHGGILNGKAVSLPHPEYPADARTANLQGTVLVDVVIDESGGVVSAVAASEPRKTMKSNVDNAVASEIEPADPILREAAERAALQARFAPTLLSGTPVKVSGTIVYNFVSETPSPFNGAVLNGKATSLPVPVYPPAAMAVRAEGTVNVRITIDENGNVIEATAVSGHPLLRAAAVKAAREASFAPTMLEGKSVKVAGLLTFTFVGPKKEEDSN